MAQAIPRGSFSGEGREDHRSTVLGGTATVETAGKGACSTETGA